MNDTHLKYDEHLAMGQGSIDWKEIEMLLEEFLLKDKSRLIEVSGLDKIRDSSIPFPFGDYSILTIMFPSGYTLQNRFSF